MNEKSSTKKREWVKNAIIIFLAVMLILTFFSNTIMNYSLPEVSAQYVGSGTLSEQIRGSGTVEANQSYEIKIDETRVIASVEVSTGDFVEKGQTIIVLEDSESGELTEAVKTLEKLKKDYEFSKNYSTESLNIANKEEDLKLLKADYEKYDEHREEYELAKDEVKKYEKESESISEQLASLSGDDYSSLSGDYFNKIDKAKNALKESESTQDKTQKKIEEYEAAIAEGGNAEAISSAKQAIESKEIEIDKMFETITAEFAKIDSNTERIIELQSSLQQLKLDLKYLEEAYNSELSKSSTYSRSKQLLDSAKKTLEKNKKDCENKQDELNKVILEVRNALKSDQDSVQEKLEDAQENADKLQIKVSKTKEEAESEIRAAERELEQLKMIQQNDENLKLDEIAEQEATVEKLKSKSVGAEISAQVSGIITSLPYVAGEEAAQGTTVASIEMTEKGYTLEMTVTNEQAKKVKVGDKAEIQYFWYGDAEASLMSISSDPSNPAKNRILKFSVTGDVTPGQTLQLAMGSKGQNYEIIVPNSAIREDNNGKFILAVTAKSSPLGNRYMAKRVGIEVLASDDVSSAVSGELYGGEFIITAATKPIESGMQVRLVES